jgi:DNA mismatch repair protein MutS2
VARVLASVQAAPTARRATEAARQLSGWQETVARAARASGARAAAGAEADAGRPLAPGARVRVASLGQEGEVLEVGDGEALVRVGGLKVRRPAGDLLPLRGAPPAAPGFGRGRTERLEAADALRPAAVRAPERRRDARGLRVEELLREVDRFLDTLFAEGAPECVILHGHGTGALKQALRAHLGASPYVGGHRPGEGHEGGDAVTVVLLRT